MSHPVDLEMMPIGGPESLPPEKMTLAPHQQVEVDLDSPLDVSDELHQAHGLFGHTVATITAGGKIFSIIDIRRTNSNRDFLLIDEDFSRYTGFKGIADNEPVTVGREHHTDRFKYPATVSRDHFKVAFENGRLTVANLEPTNETVLTAHTPDEKRIARGALVHAVRAESTVNVGKRMEHNPGFGERDNTAPYGYYLNYPILGRASESVDGGVYLGGGKREAIVVDGRSEIIRNVYEDVQAELGASFRRGETLPVQSILTKVMQQTQRTMPYDGPRADMVGARYMGDQLVGLSAYVNEQAGVCRHQALLAAYMIERLIRDGYMEGGVGVERNTVEDLGGTHAWAVYKSASNEVIVVDPAQSFVGTKPQARQSGKWEYGLPSDRY